MPTSFGDSRMDDRFWSRCMPDQSSGCWLWLGSRTRDGYGLAGHRAAHRVAFERLVSSVPEGLQLDHLCRVRLCVNPEHLEPVSAKENARRGIKGVLTTHCPAGHPYDDRNTYRYTSPRGWSRRCCRACNRERNAGVR